MRNKVDTYWKTCVFKISFPPGYGDPLVPYVSPVAYWRNMQNLVNSIGDDIFFLTEVAVGSEERSLGSS